jgi:hypothetical protein
MAIIAVAAGHPVRETGPIRGTGPSLAAAGPSPLALRVEPGGPPLPIATSGGTALERWQDERIFLNNPGEWTERSRASIAQALSLVPQRVRAVLGNPSLGPLYVSVNRHGRTMSGREPYGRAANFYSTNEGRNEIVLFPDQTPRTVLHELGHAYNLRRVAAASYAQVYLEPEMTSFLSAARWRILTPASALRQMRDHAEVAAVYEGAAIWPKLSRDDPLEDFANSFALYFDAPAELHRISPARYEWFRLRFAADSTLR